MWERPSNNTHPGLTHQPTISGSTQELNSNTYLQFFLQHKFGSCMGFQERIPFATVGEPVYREY